MFKVIADYFFYKCCSCKTKNICSRLSKESGLKSHVIYGLMTGNRAQRTDEIKMLSRLKEIGIIKEVKYKYKYKKYKYKYKS